MKTTNSSSPLRQQSKRKAFRSELSTSTCILAFLYYFIRLLFKGFCAKNKKNIQRFTVIICFPVVFLLRVVKTIKWRRILNPRRMKKRFDRIITKSSFKTLDLTEINGQLWQAKHWMNFRIWKRGRKKGLPYGNFSYNMDFDVRNV
jgi:hypothetical protein